MASSLYSIGIFSTREHHPQHLQHQHLWWMQTKIWFNYEFRGKKQHFDLSSLELLPFKVHPPPFIPLHICSIGKCRSLHPWKCIIKFRYTIEKKNKDTETTRNFEVLLWWTTFFLDNFFLFKEVHSRNCHGIVFRNGCPPQHPSHERILVFFFLWKNKNHSFPINRARCFIRGIKIRELG